jgi:hypothetical protein
MKSILVEVYVNNRSAIVHLGNKRYDKSFGRAIHMLASKIMDELFNGVEPNNG